MSRTVLVTDGRGRSVRWIVAAALEAEFDGFEAFLAVADDDSLGRPTAEAMGEYFGEVPEPCRIEGEACAFSNAKAREVLDWEPAHGWRTAAGKDVPAPSPTAE